MKINNVRRNPASIAKTRWLAYATAGVATALVGSNSAEAAIHYSGLVWDRVGPHQTRLKDFPLDQAGHYLLFSHRSAYAEFSVVGPGASGFVGGPAFFYRHFVFKLPFGYNISAGPFHTGGGTFLGILTNSSGGGYWDPGIGFVGFKFNNGAQYGWARVKMSKSPQHAFTVIDYAYADPGEPIRAGQKSSDEQAPDQGSLGWLAAGAVGLLAWRKSRSRAAR